MNPFLKGNTKIWLRAGWSSFKAYWLIGLWIYLKAKR